MIIDRSRFGRELSALRGVRGMSQAALAHRTGLTVNYISLLENGARQPSVDAINSLAKALDIPAQFLTFLGAEKPPPGSLFSELARETEEAIRLVVAEDQHVKDAGCA